MLPTTSTFSGTLKELSTLHFKTDLLVVASFCFVFLKKNPKNALQTSKLVSMINQELVK